MFGKILAFFKKSFFGGSLIDHIGAYVASVNPFLAGAYMVFQIQGYVFSLINYIGDFEHPISLGGLFYPTEYVKHVLFEDLYFSEGVEKGVSKLLQEKNTNSIEFALEDLHNRNLHRTDIPDGTVHQRFLCLFSTPSPHSDSILMFIGDLFLLGIPGRINQFYYGVAYWDSPFPTSPFSLYRVASLVKKYSIPHRPKLLVHQGYPGAYPGLALISFITFVCVIWLCFKYYRG